MSTKTMIALAAALTIGSASAALASDHDDQHWDSYKEMVRQEQILRAHPGAFAGSAYGLVPSAHKPATLRAGTNAGY